MSPTHDIVTVQHIMQHCTALLHQPATTLNYNAEEHVCHIVNGVAYGPFTSWMHTNIFVLFVTLIHRSWSCLKPCRTSQGCCELWVPEHLCWPAPVPCQCWPVGSACTPGARCVPWEPPCQTWELGLAAAPDACLAACSHSRWFVQIDGFLSVGNCWCCHCCQSCQRAAQHHQYRNHLAVPWDYPDAKQCEMHDSMILEINDALCCSNDCVPGDDAHNNRTCYVNTLLCVGLITMGHITITQYVPSLTNIVPKLYTQTTHSQ